jgi:hypothetical protein
MARSPARSLFAVAGTAVALSSTACFNTSSNVTTGEYPTILTIDPALFRGLLSCGAPGLVSYVATLTDVTDAEVFPSTKPVACQAIVSYGEPTIEIDHQYVGAIDGYDRDGLVPQSVGSRTMIDAVTQEVVLPRWTTTCGEGRVVLGDGGEGDAEPDASPPSLRAPQDDAGSADVKPYNYLRAPTQVLWKEEVILRGCYPLSAVLGPDASVADAGEADATIDMSPPPDASIDLEPPDGGAPGDDAESDAGDGSTTEDGAAHG